MRKLVFLASCSLVAMANPAVALAQDGGEAADQSTGVNEIVVTARRKSENLQEVPTSVTAFGEEELEALDITGFGDIGKTVPNLDVQRQFGSASAPQYFLRGIATGSLRFETDAGIGLYVDGVYLGRPASSAFDLAAVERVEVLRGPQGTLFGRNSTGGAINFITAAPSGELQVKASATIGNYDRYKGKISVDLPAFGPLSVRLGYMHDQNDGYVRNTSAGRTYNFAAPFGTLTTVSSFGFENTETFSAAARLDLGEFVADYKFDYTDKDSSQLGQQLIGGGLGGILGGIPGAVVVPPSTTRRSSLPLDFSSASNLKVQGHSLTMTYDVSDSVTIKSISAYRKMDELVGLNDIDGLSLADRNPLFDPTGVVTGFPFQGIAGLSDRHQKQFSQELQLLGNVPVGSGELDWILGGFYFRETGSDDNPVFIGTALPTGITLVPNRGPGTGIGNTINRFGIPSDYFAGQDYSVRNKSAAIYGHLGWKSEHVELAAGFRYTKDNRRTVVRAGGVIPFAAPPSNNSFSDDNWDFDVTATYVFNPDIRAYARFATGYLSGGFIGGLAFRKETIDSYEIGLKGDFLDNRLRVNAAVFHTDRQNIQTLTFSPATGTQIISAPKGRENGFELEFTAVPTDGLTISTSVGYLDQNQTGVNSLSPKFTVSNSIQYDLPSFDNGSYISLRVDGFLKDKRLSDPVVQPSNLVTTLPSHYDINARISLSEIPVGGGYVKVSAWVQNLTNNKELEFARDLSNGSQIGVFQVPRTYGLDLGIEF